MAILTVNHVKLSFADDVILEDITFEMQKGERIGLVGVNGSGKTSLFKVLTGAYMTDTGEVSFAKDAVLGYMEQHVPNDMERTAYDEVLTVFNSFIDMERQLEALRQRLEETQSEKERDRLIQEHADLNERFVEDGGLTFRGYVRSALLGLGFEESQLSTKVGVLSGGQKAKLQLAKLLLSGANILLLDEPTNHLDIASVEWLEGFLADYSGAYIVVSHDRYFLDKVTNRTFELEYQHLESYKGNYTRYLELRAEKRISIQRVYDSKQKDIKRLEGIIEQQRRWNQQRNYVTIASKQKQIDRIAADMVRPNKDPKALKFRFQACGRSGEEVLQAEDLSLSFGEHPIFEKVSLDIRRGEKVFLLGANGCGKTSLFKILLQQLAPDSGYVKLGASVYPGYYEQAQSGLNDRKTVIDEIWDLHPSMSQTEVRSALAIFLFQGEDVYKLVGSLSGGERARILLLKLMLSKTNFLLLDEPTNHLDIGSCEALENTLMDYEGTLFIISHDRYLINKLADRIYYMDSSGVTSYDGNYDAYLAAQTAPSESAQAPQHGQAAGGMYRLKKDRDARLRKLRAALGLCENQIAQIDKEKSEAEVQLSQPEIASDYEEALRLTNRLHELSAASAEQLEQWGLLSSEIEELEAIAEY